MAKEETKTPKEKKKRDDKLVHGAYRLILSTPKDILELEPVKYFEKILAQSIKAPPGEDLPPEIYGVAEAAVMHHRAIHTLEQHMRESAFVKRELPLEFIALYDRLLNSFRQDMKTLQAIRIAALAIKQKTPIAQDPLEQLQAAESKMTLTTEQAIQKRKAIKSQKRKDKVKPKLDTEGENLT